MLPLVLSATTFRPVNAEQMPVRQRIAFPDVPQAKKRYSLEGKTRAAN